MRRAWLAIAILAASWLVGLGYYHHSDWGTWLVGLLTQPETHDEAYARQADWLLWGVMIAAATLLLAGVQPRLPARHWLWAGIGILAYPACTWPWPYGVIPLLMIAGLAMSSAPAALRGLRRLGGATITAGLVLLVQAVAVYLYEALSARSHELPWPLPHVLDLATSLIGQDAALSGQTLGLHSMREMFRLGATWELLFDPTCLAFLVGGAMLLGVRSWTDGGRGLRRQLVVLALILAAWLPVRAGLLIAIFMHRVMQTDYDAPLAVMNGFWSTPILLLMLVPPALAAWKFLSPALPQSSGAAEEEPSQGSLRFCAAALLAGLAAAAFTYAATWEPVGERQAGRVVVDEYHSNWERTDKPMDTEWYGHLSGYNYACAYDYLTRFYQMSRLTEPMTDAALANTDVLVIKCPTSAYAPDEIDRIHRFVDRGGGLVVIGEHTNVFGIGEYLNQVCDEFGFQFRPDCLFGIDSVFEELYRRPFVPHPIVQRLPPLDFAVSCSIAPGNSRGKAVMRVEGLKNSPADYHASNFYPAAFDRAEMRYGAWVQLWATRYGKGRVVAFSDSTQFSNFSAFEPGKPELLLGMIEWANYRDGFGNPSLFYGFLGLALAAGVLVLGRRSGGGWIVVAAAVILGHAAAAGAINDSNRQSLPAPQPVRPMVLVTTDRTVSGANLPKGGFIAGKEDGFGIFERWILRLGYFTQRTEGTDFASGNLAIVINPAKDVPDGYAEALVRFVEGGGRLLVLDSPKNYRSTANTLLAPFGLEVKHDTALGGVLSTSPGLPNMAVTGACEIKGGVPLSMLGGRRVAACVAYGRGTVTVVGFAGRFADANMGVTGDTLPDPAMRQVYEYEFSLLKAIVEDRLPTGAVVPAEPAVPAE
jgi:hypothetical protein